MWANLTKPGKKIKLWEGNISIAQIASKGIVIEWVIFTDKSLKFT